MTTTGNDIIRLAAQRGADAWDNVIGSIHSLDVCKSSESTCDSETGKNHDRNIITVRSIDPNTNPDDDCGNDMACADPDGSAGDDSDGPGSHITNLYLTFEDPPLNNERVCDSVTLKCELKDVEYHWTGVKSWDGDPYPYKSGVKYEYIDLAMIHEFGHAFGLPDFVGVTSLRNKTAIMNVINKESVITGEDEAQLEAIYAQHSSTVH